MKISEYALSAGMPIRKTALSKDGFDEKISVNSGVSNGSLYISIDGVPAARYDGIDEIQLEKTWNEGLKKLKEAVKPFGLSEKVIFKEREGYVSGPFWISFAECSTDDESEMALCARERVWTGENQSNTEDFTSVRDKLK